MKMIDKVSDQLRTQNFTNGQIAAVTEAIIDNFPSRVYVIAVWFIGIITSLLTIGALLLLAEGKTAEGLWVAVGAGLGALAGIFAGKD